MLKRFFKMFAILIAVITIAAHTGQELVLCHSFINYLTFYSLEDFLDAYVAAREGRVSPDSRIAEQIEHVDFASREAIYLLAEAERIMAHVDFASLETIYMLTNIPETYRLVQITAGRELVSIVYMPIVGENTHEARSDAMLNQQYFVLEFFRLTYEDLESAGYNSPLDGVMRQVGVDLTEEDLIDGKYLFCERTRNLYWAHGSNLLMLITPMVVAHGNNESSGLTTADLGFATEISINDMIRFTETVAVDLHDENNIASWRAGDFAMIDELLGCTQNEPESSTTPAESKTSYHAEETSQYSEIELPGVVAPTLRFTVGSNNFLHNGTVKQSEVAPFINHERTMVPLRIVAETLNAEVDWDSATRTVIITGRGETINLIVDVPLPGDMGTPIIVNSSTFVPVRYVSETLGATVRWDEENKAVYIYST